MFIEKFKKYKKALVIGTGGGNDIISAIIPALYLQKLGIETSVSGVLSPVANHTYKGINEKTINKIQEVKRYVETPEGTKEIGLVDNFIPYLMKDYNITDFFNFSFKFGLNRLLEDINELIEKEGYDLVVGVDVGGDILSNGDKDETTISPIMDLSTLFILGNLRVDSYIVEYGLGTDGELNKFSIDKILKELKDKNLILKEHTLKQSDEEVCVLENIYNSIKHIRKGNTNRMTIATLKANEDIKETYKFRCQIGSEKWNLEREVFLPLEYKGKCILIDAKKFYNQRKHIVINYDKPFEYWKFIKENYPHWNTEMDFFYSEGKFLLTPSLFFDNKLRCKIINYGLLNIDGPVIMLKNDKIFLRGNVEYI
jgi:hypothetical protein